MSASPAWAVGLPRGTRLHKGHACRNDFLFVDDPDGALTVDAGTVAALCDRHAGLGADGLIVGVHRAGRWYMDYRNADGSIAETCGNGIRAFVEHLRSLGVLDVGAGETVEIGTRGGVVRVWALERPPAAGERWYAVDMGSARASGEWDVRVRVPGLAGEFRGMRVAMPNPHTVVELRDAAQLRAALLPDVPAEAAPESLRPAIEPEPAHGTNLELVVPVRGDAPRGLARLRVLERGVGETLSCGSGCCAAAVALASRPGAPSSWSIDAPGGSVGVEVGDRVVLSGPAVHLPVSIEV